MAKYCVEKTKEIIGVENITEYVEPSAGAGVFLDYLNNPFIAYDIDPEDNRILQQDWLTVKLNCKKGRCVIGNPPFGDRNSLAVKFYKKAVNTCDYISFILPVSQYNNNQKLYEFDLVWTEDLGFKNYSGISLNCAFNIYIRNNNGIRNKPVDYKLKDVLVEEYRRGSSDKTPCDYDFSMCTWGDGSCGKKNTYVGQYAQEHYITVINQTMKKRILDICNNTDWRHLYPSVSSAKLQTWKIYKHFSDSIIGIQ